VPVYSSILDFLFYRGVSGATVTKGTAGFGADHHMHSSSVVEISDRLPIKIEFIETREKVDALMGKLEELATRASSSRRKQPSSNRRNPQVEKSPSNPPISRSRARPR
jgi:PII-like signaling protein